MPQRLNLKLTNKTDIPLLLVWIEQFYQEDHHIFDQQKIIAALELIVSTPKLGKVFIIGHQNQNIGYVIVTYSWSLEYFGRDAIIDEIYIIPGQRKKGFGTEIIKKIEQELAKQGIQTVHLEVNVTNRAIDLYKRLGFIPHQTVFMSKKLEKIKL